MLQHKQCTKRALALLACGLAALACGPAGVVATAALPTATAAPVVTPAGGDDVAYVPGSTQKVCQLIGEIDRETGAPTVNRTETNWGLAGNDLGYSFEHDGKLFFLFGDSQPTRTFNGQPNGRGSPHRSPDANDAVAFTTDPGGAGLSDCPHLTFYTNEDGAFVSPVVRGADGQPAITLRTNEVPHSGLSDGGHLYVFFTTDNPNAQQSGPSNGNTVVGTRSVVAVSDDDGQTFRYLYDFSQGPKARFVAVTAAAAPDGYLYFWGTQGGDLYRQSAPSLARKPAGTLGSPEGLEYFHGLKPDGSPDFETSEAQAAFLLHDSPADCMGELSVTWNEFLQRWLMLYNCGGRGPTESGVLLRTATQPWGPWSEPQLIFNPTRDQGFCHFIHRAVTAAQPQCDNLADPQQLADSGGGYGPYVLARYTTGDAAVSTTTIYYTLSTWIPYTEVILKSSLKRET
jgi:hypothetical protein